MIGIKALVCSSLIGLSIALSGQAQSAYFNAVTNLNPVGYWPMHEAEAAAPGDIETNYGSAGSLANGYYGDWALPWSGTDEHYLIHGWPGAIAGDSDPCVYFNYIYLHSTGNEGSATNCLIVPHTSPAATLVPPFTVEFWYYCTNNLNNGKGCDIWATVNAGPFSGPNGSYLFSGIRLYSHNNLVIYCYNNNGGVNSQNSSLTIPFGANARWMHIVTTMDAGTNINVYLNGTNTLTFFSPFGYAPNYWDPLEIDTGKGYTRDASGYMDEFAIYTNALSAGEISNHYAAGINPSPVVPYHTLVLNDHPTIYFRMDSPPYTAPAVATWPVLTNYGSAAVNGVYSPGTIPGNVPGPADANGVPYGALSGAHVPQLSGLSSFADAGYAPAFDPTGAVPFTLTAMFRGNPCDSRIQTIVGHSDSSWRLNMNTNGTLQCQLGTNSSSVVNSAGVYNDANWHQAVEVYTPASVPTVAGTNALYVDGVLDASVSTVSTNGIGPGSALDVMIGTDPQYTNNPVALGRQFAGQVCEVALFANALTTAQVQQLYRTAVAITPTVSLAPSGNTVVISYAGTLQSATNVTGTYTPVSGATSPYTTPATNAQQFYRTIVP